MFMFYFFSLWGSFILAPCLELLEFTDLFLNHPPCNKKILILKCPGMLMKGSFESR